MVQAEGRRAPPGERHAGRLDASKQGQGEDTRQLHVRHVGSQCDRLLLGGCSGVDDFEGLCTTSCGATNAEAEARARPGAETGSAGGSNSGPGKRLRGRRHSAAEEASHSGATTIFDDNNLDNEGVCSGFFAHGLIVSIAARAWMAMRSSWASVGYEGTQAYRRPLLWGPGSHCGC